MDRPWLLDLFCGAGGAGEGYRRAGFHVVSVDIAWQPRNPHEFYQDDALRVLDTLLAHEEWNGYRLHDFQAIHASPPCQEYSNLRSLKTRQYAAVLPETRERLHCTRLPWVLENVVGAPMQHGVMLCGTALGLNVRRHRLFDSSHFLWPAGPCRHSADDINVYGHNCWNYRRRDGERYTDWRRPNAIGCPIPKAQAAAAFEADWMTLHDLAECVPPAYTEYIGRQLLGVLLEASA